MATLLLLVTIMLTAVPTRAIHVANPAQDQLPLVARVGQPYSWSLRADTFLPTPFTVNATDVPAWLSFDTTTLTFSGTVPASTDYDDDTLPDITLTATADDGAHVSDALGLYVSTRPMPNVSYPLAEQLRPNATPLASVFLLSNGSALALPGVANGLRVPPGWSFSIGWRHDTFAYADGLDVAYSATLADGSPLPEWLVYDTTALTFHGYSPKLPDSLSPLVLDVRLFGGDVPGFVAQGLEQAFSLAVAAHELSAAAAAATSVIVSADSPADVLLSLPADLQFDGQLISNDSNVTFSMSGLPSWLAFDVATSHLRGTPPENYTGTSSLSLSAAVDNQTVAQPVTLIVAPSLFTTPTLPALQVKPGAQIKYDVGSYVVGGTEQLAFDAPDAPWLAFDAGSRVLSGTAPSSPMSVLATFAATDPNTLAVSQAVLNVTITAHPGKKASNGGGGSTTTSSSKHSGPTVKKGLVAVIVGALLAFVVMCLLAACCRKFCSARDDAVDLERSASDRSLDRKRGAWWTRTATEGPVVSEKLVFPMPTTKVAPGVLDSLSRALGSSKARPVIGRPIRPRTEIVVGIPPRAIAPARGRRDFSSFFRSVLSFHEPGSPAPVLAPALAAPRSGITASETAESVGNMASRHLRST